MRDADIRQILRATHLSKYLSDGHSKVVEELQIPAAKAIIDMAVINGHLHGFEIKSASDTLQRLPGQIEAYTKVFDYLSIVTEDKYHQRIIESTPKWVSVYTCIQFKGKCKLKLERRGTINHDKNGFYIAKLLWHNELVEVLTEQQIRFRKKDRAWLLCEALSEGLTINELAKIVREKLKSRIDWKLPVIKDCEVMQGDGFG